MRQQVRATVVIDFDADATLSKEQLADAITFELRHRLTGLPTVQPVEAVDIVQILELQEEADLYG